MRKSDYPRIILALGAGGARGFAHIGVLQVLTENGIKVAGIVGTSMGALIGSTFAAGTDLYYLARLMEYLGWEDVIDFRLPRLGLVDGAKVQTLIDLLTKGKRFDNLEMDFWAVATDLKSGEEIVFKEGLLASAIRASVSIPGVFNPVEYRDRVLVDGAVVAGVPVKIAKEMAGDITVAVNVSFDHTKRQINNLFDAPSQVIDIMGNRLDLAQLGMADVDIRPELGATSTLDFNTAKHCILSGRKAAELAIPQLQSLIAAYQGQKDAANGN